MPIYEYQCASCEACFELMQKIVDGPPEKCPFCGHKEVRKLISKVGFHLKGTGWYEPDFKDTNAYKYIKDCLDTGWVSSSGEWVSRFESLIQEFTGIKYAVAGVSSVVLPHFFKETTSFGLLNWIAFVLN